MVIYNEKKLYNQLCFTFFKIIYMSEAFKVSRIACGRCHLYRIYYSFRILLDLKPDVN